ncbi:conserved hypothetical protein [Catenulispora acidiphila DSM 44928]|uniref:Uncharacterized protein n=1 Tax=Catenulispora acidiphila (strain DSM 44928 / JCM 14897 / NBRC 102108 / NRRL B-24433 / ID139908) TaxID=479433 RepID=C7QGI4_CATAD|nr:hypothetical protein [Catenulispora acidiphila]ACU74864.1 conserved hypothetical protein [Catenulispora acidiphila DSM 44928]
MATGLSRIQIEIGASAHWGVEAAVRPVIDGRDMIRESFVSGPGLPPEVLLRPNGELRAAPEPREVVLAEADCAPECCGALAVTIRLDGEHVVWAGWRDLNGPAPVLPEFRFDAGEYDAEIARAELAADG